MSTTEVVSVVYAVSVLRLSVETARRSFRRSFFSSSISFARSLVSDDEISLADVSSCHATECFKADDIVVVK